jgi:hypothetical protein
MDAALSVSDFTSYGTISGSSTLTITDQATFEGATLSGSGTVVLGPGSTSEVDGGPTGEGLDLSGGTLENEGTTTLETNTQASGYPNASITSPAVFDNIGTLVFSDGTIFDGYFATCNGSLENSGTIQAEGTDAGGFIDCGPVTNTGTIDLSSGTLTIGSTLDIDAGTTITGSNPLAITGTADVNAATSVPDLAVQGGDVVVRPGIILSANELGLSFATITLEGTGSTAFGSVSTSGSVSLNNSSLNMDAMKETLACGKSSVVISGTVEGTFSSVTGTGLPKGGSWVATYKATSATAKVSC